MDIRKSLRDDKEYRVVKLENGLVALLIEDHVGQERAKKKSSGSLIASTSIKNKEFESSYGSDLRDAPFSTSDSDDYNTTGEGTADSDVEDRVDSDGGMLVDSDADTRHDKAEHTKSKRAQKGKGKDGVDSVKWRPKAKQSDVDTMDMSSACGLCVNVGSFSDPTDIPGLAHLLEHMVFMGSEKYPGDNAFDVLTNRHGGYDNAFTDYERTVFTFTIHNKHLKKALDMFAQFFASPQLLEECLNREIEAVDSEFQSSIQRDSTRLQQLFCTFAKPDHPYSKFVWGNTASLKDGPKRTGVHLYKRLREFYKLMYSSHFMTLAVQSSDSLDKLEEWVRESFSGIQRNDKPHLEFSAEYPPYDQATFNKLVKVLPVKDTQEIHMTWCLPALQQYYRTKPLDYLGWLLGHEGRGSVLSYLKKRNLATSIEAGNGGMGHEDNSCFSLFSCSITLTDKGFANVDQCVLAVFQYLKMLQDLGPQERIFREIQTIEENSFNFLEDEEPLDNVENLCESMQLFPQEEYLTGSHLLSEYNPDCIAMVTNLLTPDRVNVMWLSKSFSKECDRQEEWFGINYSVQDIPEKWTDRACEANPELALPTENVYIAKDFTLIQGTVTSEFPVVIEQCDHYKLWYKPDLIFESYEAWIGLMFETPIQMESVENSVLMDMFAALYAHLTSELTYAASLAQLEYSIEVNNRGLALSVEGFSHKLHMLFRSVIDFIVKFDVTEHENDFHMAKEELKRQYHNSLLKPKKLGRKSRLRILEHSCPNSLDKVDVVDKITPSQLNDVVSRFKKNMNIEALVQGNLSHEAVKDLMKYVTDAFKIQQAPPSMSIPMRTVQLPSNTKTTYSITNRDKESPNTVLINYYQCCSHSIRDCTIAELAVACMDEPCFDTLRTKKQLGYEVYCDSHNTHGVVGLTLNLITQTSKHSVGYASKCLDTFMKKFSDNLLSWKKRDFDAQVNSLIQEKLEPDFSLKREVKRNWTEIVFKWYKFDRHLSEVDILKSLTQQDVADWLRRYTHTGEHYRQLSIQVICDSHSDQADSNSPDCDRSPRRHPQGYHTIQLAPGQIEQFKQKLFLYPSTTM